MQQSWQQSSGHNGGWECLPTVHAGAVAGLLLHEVPCRFVGCLSEEVFLDSNVMKVHF